MTRGYIHYIAADGTFTLEHHIIVAIKIRNTSIFSEIASISTIKNPLLFVESEAPLMQ